ncbi:hypothetical protein D3C87_1780160 [compost metagenome]
MRERAVFGFGEQAGRLDHFTFKMKGTFCAGDEAALARSPKLPRSGGAGVLLLADAVAEVENVDQFFDEADA